MTAFRGDPQVWVACEMSVQASLCSEHHSGLPGKVETHGVGRRAQDLGRGVRWTEGPSWYHC